MEVVHAAEAERAPPGSELRQKLLAKATGGSGGDGSSSDRAVEGNASAEHMAPTTLSPITIAESGEVEAGGDEDEETAAATTTTTTTTEAVAR